MTLRLPGLGRWLRADPRRTVAVAVAAIVFVASTAWFFTADDDRGRTARLSADAWYYHAYLPSLVLDHDLDFDNQYRITKNWYRFGKTKIGRRANVFGIGPAIFELPFYAAGRDIARLAGSNPNGFSTPEVRAALFASLLFSLGAMFFAYRLLRRRFGPGYLTPWVPVLVACGGPLVFYAVREPGYAHPFAAFWVAWLVDAWDASFDGSGSPRSLRRWLGLGALLGMAALARPQDVLWVVLLFIAGIDDLRHQGVFLAGRAPWWRKLTNALRVSAPRWLAGAAVAFVAVLPQFLAWKALYGSYYVVPQGDGFMRWDAPAWSETLFSSRNGLFVWAPIYAVAAVGLLVGLRRAPRLAGGLIAGVLLQALGNGAAWDWWAGGSFGGRRFDSCFAAFAFGLGCLLLLRAGARETMARRVGRWTLVATAGALSAILAAGNLYLAGKYSAYSVRIDGGQAAHKVLRAQIPGVVGAVVAATSHASNFPARALFAARYGTSLDAYDYVVGVHQLGELFPGLNSFKGRTAQRIKLSQSKNKLVGLDIDSKRRLVRMRGRTASILVGLNRYGPVTYVLRAAAPPDAKDAELVLFFNDVEIARGQLTREPSSIEGRVEHVRRGVNVVKVEAPPGTELQWLDVRGPQNPLRNR